MSKVPLGVLLSPSFLFRVKPFFPMQHLNLKSSTQAFDSIEMYNILGQSVIQERLSQADEIIEMGTLKDGIYLAKVSIQGQSKTFKILKN